MTITEVTQLLGGPFAAAALIGAGKAWTAWNARKDREDARQERVKLAEIEDGAEDDAECKKLIKQLAREHREERRVEREEFRREIAERDKRCDERAARTDEANDKRMTRLEAWMSKRDEDVTKRIEVAIGHRTPPPPRLRKTEGDGR
jgi:hypothetical protein